MTLSKKGRYVYCADCGCRKEMNGVCQKCGHVDNPLLAGMVPDVTGLTADAAEAILTGPEAQLTIGTISTEYDELVPSDKIISTEPVAGSQLEKGNPVNIIVSLGTAA